MRMAAGAVFAESEDGGMGLHNQRVLVTGASGFIGSHLVEHLLGEGARVRGLVHYDSRPGHGNLDALGVRGDIEIFEGDVRDPHQMRRVVEGCDVVFHLAALISVPYSYTAPSAFVATNVVGTLNILEACRDLGVQRLVTTSTSEVYGTALTPSIDEGHLLQAQSPYAASKIGADKLAESYHRTFGLPVCVLRPFNNFGPRQSRRAVIPQIAAQLLSDAPVLRLGAIWPQRDFLFVRDTCRAYQRMAEVDAAIGKTINVGTGHAVSIGQVAELLMDVVGVHKDIVTEDRRMRPENSEVGVLRCDAGLAEELLGWSPTFDLRAGLEQVVESLRQQPSGGKGDVDYRV
jgi:NAD dependent epimerase/dehydratase